MAGFIVEVHAAEAFSTGVIGMTKVFRGRDLATIGLCLRVLDWIDQHDAKVETSTSRRRSAHIAIIPADRADLIAAKALIRARMNELRALRQP